jgi:hypothetical protein
MRNTRDTLSLLVTTTLLACGAQPSIDEKTAPEPNRPDNVSETTEEAATSDSLNDASGDDLTIDPSAEEPSDTHDELAVVAGRASFALTDAAYEIDLVAPKVQTSATPVLRKTVSVRKGDILALHASKQFTEDNNTRTKLSVWLAVDGQPVGTAVSQYVLRGGGMNHHMSVAVDGHYRATEDKLVTVELVARISTPTSVTVDTRRYGGMTVEQFRAYSTGALAQAGGALFLNGLSEQGPQSAAPFAIATRKPYLEGITRVRHIAFPTSKGDWTNYHSQGSYRFISGGPTAEMVATQTDIRKGTTPYDIKGTERLISRVYMGENVTRDLTYLSHNHHGGFRSTDSTEVQMDVLAYGGGGEGFLYAPALGMLQAMRFAAFVPGVSKGISKVQSSLASVAQTVRSRPSTSSSQAMLGGRIEAARADTIVRVSAGTQIERVSGSSSVCALQVALIEVNGTTQTVIARSPITRRTVSTLYPSAGLSQTFSVTVPAGTYRAQILARCSGADFVGTVGAKESYLKLEQFEEAL